MAKEKTRGRILHLLEDGKEYTQVEIARILGVGQAAISKQLKRMERTGLVEGYGAATNRRFRLAKSGISATQDTGLFHSCAGSMLLQISVKTFRYLIDYAVDMAKLGIHKKFAEEPIKAYIQVKRDGVRIRQMDNREWGMIDVYIPRTRFKTYNITTPENIGVDIRAVSEMIRPFHANKELVMTVKEIDGKRKLMIQCDGWVGVDVITEGFRIENEPQVEYKAAAEIDGKLLRKYVHKMAEASEHIIIRITADSLALNKNGYYGEEVGVVFNRSEAKIDVAEGRASWYNAQYIDTMLKVIKEEHNVPVTIQLAQDIVKISYSAGGVDFVYYLACWNDYGLVKPEWIPVDKLQH